MSIGVVIPFLNEENALPLTLDALSAAIDAYGRIVDVVAVDGGSDDASRVIIGNYPAVRVIDGPRGRAKQMNAGAKAVIGDTLLFLHADCRLPHDAFGAVERALNGRHRWGRFDVTLDGRSKMLPTVAASMNARSRLTGVATGDQAMFVARDAFVRAGGFRPIPLMEDVALSKRLRHVAGKPACLRERVVVSGRRFDSDGAWRTIALMWRLRFDYWRGVDPAILATRYRRRREHTPMILQVFAKDPQPGFVKTRLAASIGQDAAVTVYRELVERTLATAVDARARRVVDDIELWCDPDANRDAFVAWRDRYDVTLKTQRGDDLGARMRHSLASAHTYGHAAVLIGSDCPALDVQYLALAVRALSRNDVVVGPAEDGGYVLVGSRADVDMFAGIPWSTSTVMAETRNRLSAARVALAELPTLWDVDTPADLARYREMTSIAAAVRLSTPSFV